MTAGLGYNRACTKVNEAKNIPLVEHWAIIETDSYMTDHGYPETGAQRYTMVAYYAFIEEAAWRTEVAKLLREKPDRTDMRFVQVLPVNPEVEVKLEIRFPSRETSK